ncbi:MAG: hypothetical protein KatS3mg015_2014 [Fimbriimonadales bacterium]|nr:MAG: hypothetical protein KatS3mg015_2014 [Fimbriimonadales bacterium]
MMTPNKQLLLHALSRLPGWPRVPTVSDEGQTERDDPDHQLEKADARRLFKAFPADWPGMDADAWRGFAEAALEDAQSDWGKQLHPSHVVDVLQACVALRAGAKEEDREKDTNDYEAN